MYIPLLHVKKNRENFSEIPERILWNSERILWNTRESFSEEIKRERE